MEAIILAGLDGLGLIQECDDDSHARERDDERGENRRALSLSQMRSLSCLRRFWLAKYRYVLLLNLLDEKMPRSCLGRLP